LEKNLAAKQESFVLMDDSEESATEDASPEHVRESEKKVIGKLTHYDQKAVNFAEFLVNICSVGVQNTLLK